MARAIVAGDEGAAGGAAGASRFGLRVDGLVAGDTRELGAFHVPVAAAAEGDGEAFGRVSQPLRYLVTRAFEVVAAVGGGERAEVAMAKRVASDGRASVGEFAQF